jgi:hypothetical protein
MKPYWLLSLTVLLLTPVVHAQEAGERDFNIKSIRQLYRSAPDYGGSKLGGQVPAANRPWLIMEVSFSSEPDWADDVTLKYFVLIGTGRDAKLFSASITHVNVKRRSSHYSAMFLHPNVLDRYGAGRVQAVTVQLFHKGRLIAQESEPNLRTRWWEQFTPIAGQLLPPQETPWSVVAHERYEAVRRETH